MKIIENFWKILVIYTLIQKKKISEEQKLTLIFG